jgi:hypothetical protein
MQWSPASSPRPAHAKERLQSRAVQRLHDALKSIFADAVVLRPSKPFAFVAAQLRELDSLTKLSRMPADHFSLRQDATANNSSGSGGGSGGDSLPPLRRPARPEAVAPTRTRPSRLRQPVPKR